METTEVYLTRRAQKVFKGSIVKYREGEKPVSTCSTEENSKCYFIVDKEYYLTQGPNKNIHLGSDFKTAKEALTLLIEGKNGTA
jgi:hypothetical protein